MPDKPDVLALLGSRICHDLISPLGAIGNGVELLHLSGVSGPEMALIEESVENANARIRFFRVAFGLAAPDQRIGQPEITSILNDLWRGHRLKPDWQVTDDVPRTEAKLAFLLLLCLEHAMPWGGRITLGRTGTRWSVEASADRLRVVEAAWSRLTMASGTEGPISPPEVQFALVPAELRAQKRRLEARITETTITLHY
jgi:histidine phosphotransferase ChpT